MTKKEAQQAISDAALTIGAEGGIDFVFALSQVDDKEGEHALTGIAMSGEPQAIVEGLVAVMNSDTDFKKIMIAAVNNYAIQKFFGRSTRPCNCPKCQAERKAAQQN